MSATNKVERRSLAGAFAPPSTPDRTAGLSGLLPAVPGRSEPVEPEAAAAAESRPVATEAASTRPPAVKAAAPTRPAPQDSSRVVNVGVYLEPDVLDAIRRAKRAGAGADEPDKTYDELLVDALAVVSEEDLAAHFRPAKDEGRDSLLQPRRRRPRGAGGIQVQLRLMPAQRATLDQLATRVGAGSRSALVAAAYRMAFLSRS